MVKSLGRWFPLVDQLPNAGRRFLWSDIQAGLVLSALIIPAGMGYATASGLPPITGLYATIVPLVVYALFGPSRVLVFGPDSALVPLIAGLVVPLSHGDPKRAVALAAMMSVVAGLLCMLAGLARFGFLADLLSKPVRYGYLNGIAATVFVSQIPKALGFSGRAENLLDGLRSVWRGLDARSVNCWAAAVAAATLVVVIGARKIDRRMPGALIAVVGAIVVAIVADLHRRGVSVVGDLPGGLKAPTWPRVGWDDVPRILGAAVGVAFISFADTSVMSRTYALKTGQHVDSNRELLVLGALNIATGFAQGFPVSCSQSRTPVAEDAGARTQLTGLVSAAVVTLVLIFAPTAFRHLPDAALAGIVMAAALRLIQILGVTRLWQARRSEFVLAMGAFVAVAVFGPITGIGIAIALSLLNFMRKAWRPYSTELVRVDGLKGYHDAARHPEGRRVPGLLLYRFDAPLFFANGGHLLEDVLRRVDGAEVPVKWVVITAEPVTDVDSTAADELSELLDRLDERGVRLAFAEMKGTVRDRLVPYGLVDRLGVGYFFRTTGEAVHAYIRETGVDWRDWEDGAPADSATPTS